MVTKSKFKLHFSSILWFGNFTKSDHSCYLADDENTDYVFGKFKGKKLKIDQIRLISSKWVLSSHQKVHN